MNTEPYQCTAVVSNLAASTKYRRIRKIGAYSVRLLCPRIARCKEFSSLFQKLNHLNAGFPLSAITLNDKMISHIPNRPAYNPTSTNISPGHTLINLFFHY